MPPSPRSTRPGAGSERNTLDFLIHAIGFSDKNELKGLYADTTRENFSRTMVISCFSFTEVAKRAAATHAEGRSDDHADLWRLDPRDAELQRHGRRQGGAGGERALSRRRLRPEGHPRQRAFAWAGAHSCRRRHLAMRAPCSSWQRANSPLRKSVTLEQIGGSALYYLSDLSGGVTGDIHHIDAGYHITSMPVLEGLRGGCRQRRIGTRTGHWRFVLRQWEERDGHGQIRSRRA